MGKIDSGEIGEVDPHTDSANSLLLIKYATESQSICFLPQREEAAENVRKKCIAPSLRPQASFGHLKAIPAGSRLNGAQMKSSALVYDAHFDNWA
ncbi:hypothetical protein QQF64_018661 [Cirrhinus molitorella]|uniref:Uncharacterized protein n=1 Tax=Cirrhinus molitorella TaxID=172907 RepID=A0ABR3LDB2_9TELE